MATSNMNDSSQHAAKAAATGNLLLRGIKYRDEAVAQGVKAALKPVSGYTASAGGNGRAPYSASGCFKGWASAKAGTVMQFS
jgi:hypothetical protein